MIKLDLAPSASSKVTGDSYVYISEPDKLTNSLVRLSKYNHDRLGGLAPTETNRFTTMFFDPLLTHLRVMRGTIKGNQITVAYINSILNHIASEASMYATIAEVASRVTTSVKEADAFMASITAQSPLLKPFLVSATDPSSTSPISAEDMKVNVKFFYALAGQTVTPAIANQVIDSIVFPETANFSGAQNQLSTIAAAFTAKPARPLTRLETIQMVDDIIAFYTLAAEVENSGTQGSLNLAMALHIILDTYISMLSPDSSAMSVLHQELAGQSSVVSLDVIRRITSSFSTLGLTAYLAVPTLRMLHIAELANRTAEVTRKHVPAADNAYISTQQTLQMLGEIKSMTVPYLKDLYDLSGTRESLLASPLFDDSIAFLPPVFRPLITIPEMEMIGAIDGPLPITATVPIRIQLLDRSSYFQIASTLENNLAAYRSHVMSFNVILAQYFRKAELGLLPVTTPTSEQIIGTPTVSTEYANPFSPPYAIRPVKYDAEGLWALEKYVNKPYNMYALMQDIIADQPIRFVFENSNRSLPALGGTQGSRFLSMPIPGCYAAFTERYAMQANITSFLDLLGAQAKITTRDKFFKDLSYLLLFAKGTDDFVHLYRSLAPYLMVTITGTKDTASTSDIKLETVINDFNLAVVDDTLTAWGLPLSKLNDNMNLTSAKAKTLQLKVTETIIDPISGHTLTFTYRLRTRFPKPAPLTSMRITKFSKSVLMQPISKALFTELGVENYLAVDENFSDQPVSSVAAYLSTLEAKAIVKAHNVEWLDSYTYYHEVAAAPHIVLETSKSFSQAFNYTPSDVKSMLTSSLIISDDAEGFTQVFSAVKVAPVMIVAADEESYSFPSNNRGQSTPSSIAPAVAPTEVVDIDTHTDEGQGKRPEETVANKSGSAQLLESEGGDIGGDAKSDKPAGDLIDNLRPTSKAGSAEDKAKRKKEAANLNPDTLLPNTNSSGDPDVTN